MQSNAMNSFPESQAYSRITAVDCCWPLNNLNICCANNFNHILLLLDSIKNSQTGQSFGPSTERISIFLTIFMASSRKRTSERQAGTTKPSGWLMLWRQNRIVHRTDLNHSQLSDVNHGELLSMAFFIKLSARFLLCPDQESQTSFYCFRGVWPPRTYTIFEWIESSAWTHHAAKRRKTPVRFIRHFLMPTAFSDLHHFN